MAMLSNGSAPPSPNAPAESGATGPLSYMDADITKSKLMQQFEGLVRKTASELELEPSVEDEYDDICQFLRIKVWKALEAFNPQRVKKTSKYSPEEQRRRFVFSCLFNAKKDVLKKKKHNLLFIDDVAPVEENGVGRSAHTMTRSGFEEKYLALDEEDVYGDVGDVPMVPVTLTQTERDVLLLLILDYRPAEIAVKVSLSRAEVHAITRDVREKMTDWHPENGGPRAEALVGAYQLD